MDEDKPKAGIKTVLIGHGPHGPQEPAPTGTMSAGKDRTVPSNPAPSSPLAWALLKQVADREVRRHFRLHPPENLGQVDLSGVGLL
jgi:hypothetical protein